MKILLPGQSDFKKFIRLLKSPSWMVAILIVMLLIIIFIFTKNILEVKGTLVIAIPTTNGLVIAADKRSNDRIRGDLDITDKIRQVGKFTAFSATGTPEFLNPNDFTPMWSVEKVVKSFHWNDTPLSAATLNPLAEKLKADFKKFLKTLDYKYWPASADSPQNALFLIIFFQYQRDIHQYRIQSLVFCYKKQYPEPDIKIYSTEVPISAFHSSHIMAYGNISVYQELVLGKDSRFDTLRSHSEIKRFILDTTHDKPLVTSKRAIEFSKYFIRKCSEFTPLIDKSTNHIGSMLDIAIIDQKDGFKWLAKRTKAN